MISVKKRTFTAMRLGLVLLGSLLMTPGASAISITEQSSSTANQTTTGLTSFFNTMWMKAPGWIAAMIVFACSLVVAKMVKEKVLDRVSQKFSDDDQDILVLIGRTTYVAVLGVGVTISLSIAGLDLTALLAAVGFGVGFAMQDLIMNFMAGIMILLNRPFSIGDFIQINNTIGKVEEIQARATILKALDGTKVIVPNADLFKNQVTSFTSNPFRRVDVEVGLDYNTDLAHATRVIFEALTAHPKVLQDPPPAIVLDGFGDSCVDVIARFWVESRSQWLKTKSEVVQLLKQHMDAAGVIQPFPTQNLTFDPENEKVVFPSYRLSPQELNQHRDELAAQQTQLATEIAKSAERISKTPFAEGVVLHAEGVAPVGVVVTEPLQVEEKIVLTGPAIPPEELTPPPMVVTLPMSDRESGANFLKAQGPNSNN